MKIFGRGKQDDDMAAEEIDGAEIEAGADDGDAGFDDTEAGLAAPKRFGGGGGGSNKRLIALLGVVVVLGGGGYAALSMLGGDDVPMPPRMAAIPAQPMTPPGAAPAPMAAPGMPGAVDPNAPAMPAVDPVTGQPLPAAMAAPGMNPPGMNPPGAPAMPGAVTADGTVTPATDAGMPPMPAVPPTDAAAAPQAVPAAGTAAAPNAAAGATPAATDVTAAVTAPAADPNAPMDPNAPPATANAPTGAPAGAPTAAVDPIDAENGAEPAGMQAPAGTTPAAMPTAPAAVAAAGTGAAGAGTAEAAPVSAQPGAALPPPPSGPAAQADKEEAARAQAAQNMAQAAGNESNGLAAMNAQPANEAPAQKSPAEMTPEELAAMWATLPAEPAMVRPLPKKYLIVKKEASADTLDSRLASARRALNEGRPAAALEFFNTLLADYPSDGRVLMGRAVTLQRLGQNVEALRAYEQVLVNDPQNLDALTNMLGLLKQQNPQLAIDKLLALRNAYPYNADITTQLAIAYGDAGNLPEALRYMTLAEALQPDSGFVKYNKAILYDRMGRESEAAELYRQLIRMSADGSLDQNLPMDAIKARLATMR